MTYFHLVAHILSETCQVEPHQRTNCGHPGITAKECKDKGCCFDSTVRGVPWCFQTAPMEEGRALSTPQSLNTRDHGTLIQVAICVFTQSNGLGVTRKM